MNNPFTMPGEWLKGNLHTHSTESDGEPTPQQIVDIYAEHNYDFLAITDHNKLTDISPLDAKGLTLIPGSELNGGRGQLGQHYHLVVLGLREPPPSGAELSLHELIELALQLGELCWIAHPSWSSLSSADLSDIARVNGLEAYNTTCHRGIGRGESFVQWDELLVRGHTLWGLGVDDAHWHYPDALGGWIWLKAASRKPEDIMAALQAGLFYGSCGPVFHQLEWEGRELHMECSPVQEIRLINPRPGVGWTSYQLGRPGPYRELQMKIPDNWNVVRIEIVDEYGRKAWTNPFYFLSENADKET